MEMAGKMQWTISHCEDFSAFEHIEGLPDSFLSAVLGYGNTGKHRSMEQHTRCCSEWNQGCIVVRLFSDTSQVSQALVIGP